MNEVGREWAGWWVWGGLGEVNIKRGKGRTYFWGLCREEKDQSELDLDSMSDFSFVNKRRLFERGLCGQER